MAQPSISEVRDADLRKIAEQAISQGFTVGPRRAQHGIVLLAPGGERAATLTTSKISDHRIPENVIRDLRKFGFIKGMTHNPPNEDRESVPLVKDAPIPAAHVLKEIEKAELAAEEKAKLQSMSIAARMRMIYQNRPNRIIPFKLAMRLAETDNRSAASQAVAQLAKTVPEMQRVGTPRSGKYVWVEKVAQHHPSTEIPATQEQVTAPLLQGQAGSNARPTSLTPRAWDDKNRFVVLKDNHGELWVAMRFMNMVMRPIDMTLLANEESEGGEE